MEGLGGGDRHGASIVGMGSRYLSHLRDRDNIKRAAHNQPPKE